MAVYLLVFMGAQAIGSFLWGAISTWTSTGSTLLIAAALLALCAASVPFLPLDPQTGTLDRSIVAFCLPTPTLVFDPEPLDGPVLIVRRYTVPAAHTNDFVMAMRLVEQTQRRTGATSWHLFRSGETQGEFREEFTMRSWSEFQAQGSSRWTGYDREQWDAAVSLATGTPTEEHLFLQPTR